MRTVAIVQARMGSKRLPGKVLAPIGGRPMIALLLERLARAARVDGIVLATSVLPRDNELARAITTLGYPVIRGSETDVLDRYHRAAQQIAADIVVRITGDCPVVDPAIVDDLIELRERQAVDYASNIAPPSFPDGLDVEVFTAKALHQACVEATTARDREHVTPYLRESGKFTAANLAADADHSGERWTVDGPEDLEVIRHIFGHFAPHSTFAWKDVLALSKAEPAIFALNRGIARNAGSNM